MFSLNFIVIQFIHTFFLSVSGEGGFGWGRVSYQCLLTVAGFICVRAVVVQTWAAVTSSYSLSCSPV